jgi:hypothetical protein
VEELDKLQMENRIVEFRPLNEEKAIVYYEPMKLDETVNKPSFLGSFILGYSRQIMDKYINAINGYHNIETSFYRTDTDSLIIHASQLDNVKQYIGKNLGDIDFDIQGKIIRFAEVCPKVYICEYEKKYNLKKGEMKNNLGFDYNGDCEFFGLNNKKPIFSIKERAKLLEGESVIKSGFKHVRAKGFSQEEQKLLSWNDFKGMLFHEQKAKETSALYDKFGNQKGEIIREADKIVLKLDDKLKKIGFNLNSKQVEQGYSFSSIVSQKFERTLNKTTWEKRVRIPNHPNLASLPMSD